MLPERWESLVRSPEHPFRTFPNHTFVSSATYMLGPLKSRLSREMGTSNTEFGLLLAALSLSGTWTPLVGGVIAARFGTAISSIMATGIVFLGDDLLGSSRCPPDSPVQGKRYF